MKRTLIATVAAVGLIAGAALSIAPADAAGVRMVDFEAGTFANAIAGGKANYFLTYSLENSRDAATTPKLRLELRTNTDKTYGDAFDSAAFAAAVEKLDDEVEYKSATKLRAAELASGASAAGMAQFGRIDPNADFLEVRVYGLYDPVYRTRKGAVYSENRVLVLDFRRRGDEYNRPDDAIKLVDSRVEVEGEPVLLRGGDE